MGNKNKARLFFALLPDQEVVQKIKAIQKSLAPRPSERVIPSGRLHITLKYIGYLDLDLQQELVKKYVPDLLSPFTLKIDDLGYWRRPRVYILSPTMVPEKLQQLRNHVDAVCESLAIENEARAYRPHITLIRKGGTRLELPAIEPIEWPVDDVALMASYSGESGVEYRVIKKWRLMPER